MVAAIGRNSLPEWILEKTNPLGFWRNEVSVQKFYRFGASYTWAGRIRLRNPRVIRLIRIMDRMWRLIALQSLPLPLSACFEFLAERRLTSNEWNFILERWSDERFQPHRVVSGVNLNSSLLLYEWCFCSPRPLVFGEYILFWVSPTLRCRVMLSNNEFRQCSIGCAERRPRPSSFAANCRRSSRVSQKQKAVHHWNSLRWPKLFSR